MSFRYHRQRAASSPIGLFLRVGEMSYVQAEGLHHEGRLPIRHAIFDASKFKYQKGFAKRFGKRNGDHSRYQGGLNLRHRQNISGNAAGAPWADEKLHQLSDYSGRKWESTCCPDRKVCD